MFISRVRLVVGVTCVLFVMIVVSGCSSSTEAVSGTVPATPAVETSPALSGEPTSASPVTPSIMEVPEVRSRIDSATGAANRPTVSEAEQEVLRVAQMIYPQAGFESANIKALGRDSQGRWWVQAWTPSDSGESEQWFLIRAGNGWTYVAGGTGTDRGELPADIAWEDVR